MEKDHSELLLFRLRTGQSPGSRLLGREISFARPGG